MIGLLLWCALGVFSMIAGKWLIDRYVTNGDLVFAFFCCWLGPAIAWIVLVIILVTKAIESKWFSRRIL